MAKNTELDEAFLDEDASERRNVQELVSQAPSRVEAARRVAYGYATNELIPEEMAVSSPIPASNTAGAALAFMFYRSEADLRAKDYLLFEPLLAVTVDVTSLLPLRHEFWSRSDEGARRGPVCPRWPPATRDLTEAHRDALYAELDSLYDQVLPLVGRSTFSEAERAAVARWDLLFHFLVPAGMFPYYERLNPAFFTWLSHSVGTDQHRQVETPPVPKPDFKPRSRILPERYDGLALAEVVPPANTWRVSGVVLQSALQELGLSPQVGSPLASLPNSPGISGPSLATEVEEWQIPEWRAALRTLCDPGWEVVQVHGGKNQPGATRSCYIGRDPQNVLWVGHFIDKAKMYVISFPFSPLQFHLQAVALLGVSEILRVDQAAHLCSPAEFAVLAVLADLRLLATSGPFAPTLDGIRQIRSTGNTDGSLHWSSLVSLLSPVPLDLSDDPMRLGVSELFARGLLRGNLARPEVVPELDGFLQGLGRPVSYYALAIHALDKQGKYTTGGFSAIRTEQRLWIWEMASNWSAARPPSEAKIQMFQVTGEQFLTILDAFLGGQPSSEPMRAARFCRQCGTPLRQGARFCTKCGHAVAR